MMKINKMPMINGCELNYCPEKEGLRLMDMQVHPPINIQIGVYNG